MVSPCPSKKKNDEFAESELNKKLVPGEKPLLNHKFYLDLKNRLVASKLETQIKELGGTIEVFLVKEVCYVVTDRESWQSIKTTPSTPVVQENSTFSSNESPRSSRSVRPKSRADAMLERARSQATSIVNDPLDDAKQWGITIWTVEKVFAWLEQVKEQLKKKIKVFPLKEPYIKFEAFDKRTRPIFKEIPDWPTIHWCGRKGDPAFICKTTVASRRNMTRKTRVNHRREDTLRPGYCEVCRVEYNHLEKHQQSEKHQKFINDNANFIGLDTLINESTSIETFLKLHTKEEKMCESDTEYSPPKRGRKPKNISSSVNDKEKLKNLLLSTPTETGGHRLRSRTHINYAISTPTDDDYSHKMDSPVKETRELRSSSRLLSKAVEKARQEHEQNTWESGRPKRSCILNRKRISADERLVVDNKTYYKVEVMLNKLRSSGLTARDHDLLKQHRSPSPEKKSKESEDEKGLIVKFRRIRNSELTYLNTEAENFLFPKKEETSDEDPDADAPNTTVSSNRHESSSILSSETEENDKTEVSHRKRTNRIKAEDDSAMDGFSNEITTIKRRGRPPENKNRLNKIKLEDEGSIDSNFSVVSNSKRKDIVIDDGSMDSTCSETKKKRRRTQAEAFIMDNQKYYKFETPGSRLRYQGSFLPPVTSTSKVSPSTKNNGECQLKTESTSENTTQSQINLDEVKYSFEIVPEKEPWYEAFRRQDTGQVIYLPFSDIDISKPFFLPYQLPPLPPLNPKVCIAAYKLQQKLSESASTSHEQTTAALSEGESSTALDEDSKASTTSVSDDLQSELFRMIEEPQKSPRLKKRRYVVQGRNPRKSPRQHASTLAILSSFVHHRKKRGGDLMNSSRYSADLNDSKHKLTVIKEEGLEGQEQEDYEEIEQGIERMFEVEDDKYLQDLDTIPEHEGVDLHCVPNAIEALQTYDEMKQMESTKTIKRLLNGSTLRKPGRKKKTNKTGWPNRNRRNAAIRNNKETCSTKEEEEEEEEPTTNIEQQRRQQQKEEKCNMRVKSVEWNNASKDIVAKINNCEFQPIVRVQKLDNDVMVRHKRSCSVDTEKRAKRTQSSPKSPRALRKPRGRWYKER